MTSKPEDAENTPEVDPVEVPAEAEASAEVVVEVEVVTTAEIEVAVEVEPVAPPVPDERLLAAHDLALAALHEITPATTVGDPAGYRVESDGVVSLLFANLLPGYPNWFWTVSLAVVDDAEPTVLEAELLPGEGALLAPDWVPWAVRLAEYQAQQAFLAAAEGEASVDDIEDAEDDEDLDDELSDVDDLDAVDFDRDGSRILHAGDVDGVDIDELGESDEDEDEGSDDDADADEDDEDEGSDDDADADDSDEDDDEFEEDESDDEEEQLREP